MSRSKEPDYQLYLVTRGPLDPGKVPPPKDQHEDAWYIVQFNRPLRFEEQKRLRETYHLRLSNYLPNLSYLEWLSPQMWEALSRDELYRASLLYQPSDKISPRIADFNYSDNQQGQLLRAVLFPEANPEDFKRALLAIYKEAALNDKREAGFDAEQIKVFDDRRIGGDIQVVFPMLPREDLLKVARRRDVYWIEEEPEINLDCPVNPEPTPGGLIQSGTVGFTPVWDKGIQGQQQVIGVTDSAINVHHCMFSDANANPIGQLHRKLRGLRQLAFNEFDLHGHIVAALAAGHDPSGGLDLNRGMAWEAKLSLDASVRVNNTMLSVLMSQAADDAFIHSNSWHKGAGYNQVAVDVDTFVSDHEEHFVCGSSGNTGESIGPPGTAKNALCVSASGNAPQQLQFRDGVSGPVSNVDLRHKPEICAPGCRLSTATGGNNCNVANVGSCASSWATPVIAGAAALVRQYYLEGWFPTGTKKDEDSFRPSGALIKATLLNSTVKMASAQAYPSNREGWGLVKLINTLFFADEVTPKLFIRDISNATGLRTEESHTYTINVKDDSRPLKITLVWSDSPATLSAALPLVNNLNLIVVSPDQKTFIGNQFDQDGISIEGGEPDDLNNVEMVIRNQGLQGVWTITVFCAAANVALKPQGYALVVTAALD